MRSEDSAVSTNAESGRGRSKKVIEGAGRESRGRSGLSSVAGCNFNSNFGKIMAMPLHVELRGTLRKWDRGSTTASVYITHPRTEGAVGEGSLNKDIVLTEALWMRGPGSDRGIDRRECSLLSTQSS